MKDKRIEAEGAEFQIAFDESDEVVMVMVELASLTPGNLSITLRQAETQLREELFPANTLLN